MKLKEVTEYKVTMEDADRHEIYSLAMAVPHSAPMSSDQVQQLLACVQDKIDHAVEMVTP